MLGSVRVALDIDGTVIDAEGRAYPEAVERAGDLAQAEVLVGYVTYRGEGSEEATRRRLAEMGLPDVPVHGCPPAGVIDAAGVKADLLEHLDATHYVGDAPFDREAAERAGCAFLHAEDWREGGKLPRGEERG